MNKFYYKVCLDTPSEDTLTQSKFAAVIRVIHSLAVGALQKMEIESSRGKKVQSIVPLLDEYSKVMAMPTNIVELKGDKKQYIIKYDDAMLNDLDLKISDKYNDTLFIVYLIDGPLKDEHFDEMFSLQVKYTGIDDEDLFVCMIDDVVVTANMTDGEEVKFIISAFQIIVKTPYSDSLIESVDKAFELQSKIFE